MCKMASFLYKADKDNKVEIALHDLESHSGTQQALGLTEAEGWYEGHYTPAGEIELRTPSGRNKEAEQELRYMYPTFSDFIWDLFLEGTLPQSGSDTVKNVLRGRGAVV